MTKARQYFYGFTAANGVPFIARRCDYHGKPCIEFYDCRYGHSEYGQFVSRYYVETLVAHSGGLNLYNSEPQWRIDAANFAAVQRKLCWNVFSGNLAF